ncbi:hypothetical protein F5Y08DRAFT_23743 [Xylaria arbuscula]|nr:hypothetical protein F5Y08DRAFT_23743 [Xylaria arbuscula]
MEFPHLAIFLTLSIAAGFLSNLLSRPEDPGARVKQDSAADIGTTEDSDHVPPRRKRPRTDDRPSPEPEVISLLSSDEEDSDTIQRTRRVPVPVLRRRRVGLSKSSDTHCSGEGIPSHLKQDVEYPDLSPFLAPEEVKTERGDERAGTDFCAEPNQKTDATTAPPNNLPASDIPKPDPIDHGDENSAQLRIPIKEPSLCPEQAELVEVILSGRNVFYTGSAGCGKSTVLKVFTRQFRDRGLQVDIVAPTGISALGVGGSTTFVYAGWSLSSFKRPLNKVRAGAHGKHVRKRLKATDVLVIDEISSK